MRATATRGDDYVVLCQGLQRVCGIDLSQYKRGQMERRIRTFASARGATDLAAYLRRLQTDADELDAFLDRITINVSQLFRNPTQWTLLAERVLPDLAARGSVRAWSAGCSYGAEAYTLAAIARDAVPRARIEIVGTDIDKRMVERARLGRYDDDDARTAPPSVLTSHFARTADGWQATATLKATVRFEVGDLLRMAVPRERYDLVLCRNTVIYFTPEVRDALHERLVTALRPGGYLMIGSTERVTAAAEIGLEPCAPFTYRKT
jgi:chemotaxis protein methyltransferase CheR